MRKCFGLGLIKMKKRSIEQILQSANTSTLKQTYLRFSFQRAIEKLDHQEMSRLFRAVVLNFRCTFWRSAVYPRPILLIRAPMCRHWLHRILSLAASSIWPLWYAANVIATSTQAGPMVVSLEGDLAYNVS